MSNSINRYVYLGTDPKIIGKILIEGSGEVREDEYTGVKSKYYKYEDKIYEGSYINIDETQEYNEYHLNKGINEHLKPHLQSAKFDLKKTPWFVKVNENEAPALITWLLSQGVSGPNITTDSYKYLTNVYGSSILADYAVQADEVHPEAIEFKVEYELVVKDVEFPEIITDTKDDINRLEQLKTHIDKLIGELK